jgi:hypothetical protein
MKQIGNNKFKQELEDWFIKKMLLIEDYLNEEFCNVG